MLNIEENSTTTNQFALFALAFRPFFLGAGLFAVISVLVWMAVYIFNWQHDFGAVSSQVWHAHEMIYGYAMAVVAGFLLTAIKNWTGIVVIYVAQGHDVLADHFFQIDLSFSTFAYSDCGNIQFVTGRNMSQTGNCITRDYGQGQPRGTYVLYKISSFHIVCVSLRIIVFRLLNLQVLKLWRYVHHHKQTPGSLLSGRFRDGNQYIPSPLSQPYPG